MGHCSGSAEGQLAGSRSVALSLIMDRFLGHCCISGSGKGQLAGSLL